MTISSETYRKEYSGGGTAGPFQYDFRILSDTHLKVYVASVLKTLNTHYTVSGVGAIGGGNVTFKTGYYPASGASIVIVRSIPLKQETDYVEYESYPAEVQEDALDKLTMQVQQLQEQLDRIPKLIQTSLLKNLLFPVAASGWLKWNAAADALETGTVTMDSLLNLITAKGDLIRGGSTGLAEKYVVGAEGALFRILSGQVNWLAPGSENQILKITSGAPAWGSSPDASAGLRSTTRKLLIKNNVTTPNTKLDITADDIVVFDSTGLTKRVESVSQNADITASGAGGLDTGSEASSTWYHVFEIYNPSTTTWNTLLSLSSTAPTMPSGYTYKGYLGAIYNDAGGNFIKLYQMGNVAWVEKIVFLSNGVATSITAVSLTAYAPPTAKRLLGSAALTYSSAAGTAYISMKPDSTELARVSIGQPVSGQPISAPFLMGIVNSEIYYFMSNGGTSVTLSVDGWEF